jgi:hypothetical protein
MGKRGREVERERGKKFICKESFNLHPFNSCVFEDGIGKAGGVCLQLQIKCST